MTYLFIDLETLPTEEPWVKDEISENTTHPGNMSKPETIAAWERDKKPAAVKEALVKTAVDTSLAQILCIGYAIDDQETKVITGDEISILNSFFSLYSSLKQPLLVGHNIVNFDLPLLYHRAIINGADLPDRFPSPSDKPWDMNAHDTSLLWGGIKNYIKLDRLAKLLGVGDKGGISGADVYPMYLEGKKAEIYDYCASDVELTRRIYNKIMSAKRSA